jgi:hypothetical protein
LASPFSLVRDIPGPIGDTSQAFSEPLAQECDTGLELCEIGIFETASRASHQLRVHIAMGEPKPAGYETDKPLMLCAELLTLDKERDGCGWRRSWWLDGLRDRTNVSLGPGCASERDQR